MATADEEVRAMMGCMHFHAKTNENERDCTGIGT